MSSGRPGSLSGMTTTAETFTVGEGDDLITYDVRGDLGSGRPLFLFGSPMDATGFGTLAGLVRDRPVVTYDPRGAGRNPEGTTPVPPELHAEDLHRVIGALGVGPVDCFGTSGGGVNLLALATAHPEDIRRGVVHEPATAAYLPDRDTQFAAAQDLVDTYQKSGNGPAMAKFIQLVMFDGELPADYLDRPAPDPAMFGMPAEDDGTRTNPLFRNGPACQQYEVDVEALRALGERLVVAYGATSGEGMPARAARSVAALLGAEAVQVPGGHNGFSGGEYGQPAGKPEAFAAGLLDLLAD